MVENNPLYCKIHNRCFSVNKNMIFYCPECMEIEVKKHREVMKELMKEV